MKEGSQSSEYQPNLPKVFEIDDWKILFTRPSAEQKAKGRLIIFQWFHPESEEREVSHDEFKKMVESGTFDMGKYSIVVRENILLVPRIPRELEVIAAHFFLSLHGEFEEVGNTARRFMEKMELTHGLSHDENTGKKLLIDKNREEQDSEEFSALGKSIDEYNGRFGSWIIFRTYHEWKLGIQTFAPDRQKRLEDVLNTIPR